MKKVFLLTGLLYLGLTSCKEDSLLDENPSPPSDNIELNFLPYYGEDPLKMDSIYTNSVGSSFMIDTVSLLISDISFEDRNLNETIDTAKNFVLLSTYKPSVLTGKMPAMGYYGNFQLIAGLDSLGTINNFNKVLEIGPEWLRKDPFGIDFFKIKGRYLDPASPPGDSAMLPMEYTIGTYMLSDTAKSDIRGFSIDNLQQIKIFLLTDLKPLLNFIPVSQVDEIISDPSDTQDFTIAKAMADSLNIGIF